MRQTTSARYKNITKGLYFYIRLYKPLTSRRLPWPKVLYVLYLRDNNLDSFFFHLLHGLSPSQELACLCFSPMALVGWAGLAPWSRVARPGSAFCHQPQYSVLTCCRPLRGFVAFLSRLHSGLPSPPQQGEALQQAGGTGTTRGRAAPPCP